MNIVEILSRHHKGNLIKDAQTRLESVVRACRTTGKKGSVTIKIDVAPDDNSVIELEMGVSAKCPEPNKKVSRYWDSEDGRLHDKDPDQDELPLQVVENAIQPTTPAAVSVAS